MKNNKIYNRITPIWTMVPFLLVVLAMGCRKTPAPPMVMPEVKETEVNVGQTEVKIKGDVDYPGKIFDVDLLLGRDTINLKRYDTDLDDNKSFSVLVNNLSPAKHYYYRYTVDYGMEAAFETEIRQFITDSIVVEDEMPQVKTGEVTDITMSTAKCAGEVTDEGTSSVTERGVCYGISANPTVNDSCVSNGTGMGQYAVQLSGLTPNTSYHVRAYAKSAVGVSYGNDVTFTTLKEIITQVPVVTTNVVTEISMVGALLGGEVIAQGASHVTSRGVCWGITHNPVPTSGNYMPCGSGMGVFSVAVSDLVPNTIYYVRAYATNSYGTSYGSEVSFITQNEISTDSIVIVTQTTAWCGGTVRAGGGAAITERGICWSSEHNPTMEDNYIQRGLGTGTFHVTIEDLSPNSTYYIRACCISGRGVSYGNEVAFLTKADLPIVVTNKTPHFWLTTATLGGSVTVNDGSEVTERGICWSTAPNPDVSGNHLSAGEGEGSFEVQIDNLQEGTQYHYRAYAKNREGIAYGDQVIFTTYAKPVVETSDAEVLSNVSASIGGVVTSQGSHSVTERGVCWSRTHYPTTDNSYASCGNGEGAFSATIEELTPSTVYYYRAYAVSTMGKVYGLEKQFKTMGPPTVQTVQVAMVSSNGAEVVGNVTDTGGTTITECGICWGTQTGPTINGNHGTGSGNPFTVALTGLAVNTLYYVRAYAINQYGVAYGEELTFYTIPLSGSFSVAAGQQVRFSLGNLQYRASSFSCRVYLPQGFGNR